MKAFVSYAQNFEDVVLYRALKDIEQGYYVDCGAYHPTRASVTNAFYERGWRGINVEPVASRLREFVKLRPLDINLAVALSDQSTNDAEFYEIIDSGLSTFDPDLAQQHVNSGFVARKIKVPTVTLAETLDEFAPEAIHFLKIDVEGAERLVLSGMDFARYRPWIVIVEATRPLTQTPCATDWEQILLSAGYDFAYFDGLNRFYVSHEQRERVHRLAIPPNVFDNFINVEQAEEINRVRASYEQSISWRVTAPLRTIKAIFQELRDRTGSLITNGAVRTAPHRWTTSAT